MYRLEFKSSVKKDLDKIPQKDLESIRVKIIGLEKNPLPAGVRKIRKTKGYLFRLREGKFRILDQIDFLDKKIGIISIRLRNEKTYKL